MFYETTLTPEIGPRNFYLVLLDNDGKEIGGFNAHLSPYWKSMTAHVSHDIRELYRGNGFSRLLDSVALTELKKLGVDKVTCYVPNAYGYEVSDDEITLKEIWAPPAEANGTQLKQGGMRSAGPLLTPRLVDGRPLKSRISDVIFSRSTCGNTVHLSISIDLNAYETNCEDPREIVLRCLKEAYGIQSTQAVANPL